MSTAATPIDSRKPANKQELIAANIKLLIEQLEAGQSDTLTRYLTAMSHFHNYSFGNVLEIARQMPTATRVAGFWSWKKLGRSVSSGAKRIRILAPIIGIRRKKDEEAKKDITRQYIRVLLGFRNAYVFDVSQTNGVDLPHLHEVEGDPGENVERLAAFLKGEGIQLVYNANIAPALGISYGGRIAILPGQPKAEEFSTLGCKSSLLLGRRSPALSPAKNQAWKFQSRRRDQVDFHNSLKLLQRLLMLTGASRAGTVRWKIDRIAAHIGIVSSYG